MKRLHKNFQKPFAFNMEVNNMKKKENVCIYLDNNSKGNVLKDLKHYNNKINVS